jgi:hypothetical protein
MTRWNNLDKISIHEGYYIKEATYVVCTRIAMIQLSSSCLIVLMSSRAGCVSTFRSFWSCQMINANKVSKPFLLDPGS